MINIICYKFIKNINIKYIRMSNPISLKLLDIYFRDNPSFLVNHHLESYNDFFDTGLAQLLKEKNPIHFFKNQEIILPSQSLCFFISKFIY